jgi:hypothetical protein
MTENNAVGEPGVHDGEKLPTISELLHHTTGIALYQSTTFQMKK